MFVEAAGSGPTTDQVNASDAPPSWTVERDFLLLFNKYAMEFVI